MAEQTAEEIQAAKEFEDDVEAQADIAISNPTAWKRTVKYLPEALAKATVARVADKQREKQIEDLRETLVNEDELPKDADKRLKVVADSLAKIAACNPNSLFKTDKENYRGSAQGSWRRSFATMRVMGGDIQVRYRQRNK